MQETIKHFKIKQEACYEGSNMTINDDENWEGIGNPEYCNDYAFFDQLHPTTKFHKMFFEKLKPILDEQL